LPVEVLADVFGVGILATCGVLLPPPQPDRRAAPSRAAEALTIRVLGSEEEFMPVTLGSDCQEDVSTVSAARQRS
jgi:hypothetical protein